MIVTTTIRKHLIGFLPLVVGPCISADNPSIAVPLHRLSELSDDEDFDGQQVIVLAVDGRDSSRPVADRHRRPAQFSSAPFGSEEQKST